jgi:NAD dependent epimerase/dehydratase family enzyme
MKMVLGERSILILGSQKVSADLILSKGFVFQFSFLPQALKDVFGKKE